MKPRLLALAGSTRQGSHNRRLLAAAVEVARDAGAAVEVLDLRELSLPLYDADLEARGVPAHALEIKRLVHAHHGLLFASPENNASVSAVLKNMLDWVSRPAGNPPGLVKLQGKTAAILSATTGQMGGLRGMAALRVILQSLGALTLPEQYGLSRADRAFDEHGRIADAAAHAAMAAVVGRLVEVTARLG